MAIRPMLDVSIINARAASVLVRRRRALAAAIAALLLMAGAPSMSLARTKAASADSFLNSLGINIHVDQGIDPNSYVEALKYTGVRQVRDGERHVDGNLMIAQKTGVHYILNSGGDLNSLIASTELLAKNGALLALEGPNEPNNFPIKYKGQQGGGQGKSWIPVAQYQADLYAAAKRNPLLRQYPVFSPSEVGAQTDNVGLQFLTIPPGVDTTIPPGTKFADYANIHNYVSGNGGVYGDNQAWNAASPTLNERWDGLFGNNGLTWFRHYKGYGNDRLQNLPRVTTETGWDTVANPGGEHTQGAVVTNTYLAQFKRGWSYTFIYQMRDGEGGDGNQGIYVGDNPKRAAVYIHNLTTILSDDKPLPEPGSLDYEIPKQPNTVHDLLLQKSTGAFALAIWGERVQGTDAVTVKWPAAHKTVNIYDVTLGTTPIRTLTNAASVELILADHALIVEIID